MADYSSQIASAQATIKRKGRLIQWRQFPPDAPADASKPWLVIVGTPLNFDAYIAFLPAGSGKSLLQYMGQTEIVSGAVIGFMGAVPFTPKLNDIVIRDSETLRVKSIDTIKPAEQDILHVLQLLL